jgi:hypothetical protein
LSRRRVSTNPPRREDLRHPFAIFGLVLTLSWLVVAVSSYEWIKEWRRQLVRLSKKVESTTRVRPATAAFAESSSEWFLGRLMWRFRPTMVTCLLPPVFFFAWIYLGWIVV